MARIGKPFDLMVQLAPTVSVTTCGSTVRYPSCEHKLRAKEEKVAKPVSPMARNGALKSYKTQTSERPAPLSRCVTSHRADDELSLDAASLPASPNHDIEK